MTAPASKVTYKEILWSLIKITPPIVLSALIYKPLRSQLTQDQYMTALADTAFFFILCFIVRWGAGDVLKRLKKEEEDSKK
jgi:hypothetical protein